jgi:hypothetical protein
MLTGGGGDREEVTGGGGILCNVNGGCMRRSGSNRRGRILCNENVNNFYTLSNTARKTKKIKK